MNSKRIAFSTLAFPNASLATAVSLGRSWGYAGVELRLIDGELIDSSMPGAERARVKRTVATGGLPIIAVDSSIRLTDNDPGPELRRFLELANEWESPVVRVFGGSLPREAQARQVRMEAAAKVLVETAPLAERLGVAIGLETHDDFSASKVVTELMALVDSTWIGVVWDSHHPYRMGEQPSEVYERFQSRVLLAQVKDAARSPTREDGWQLVLLGKGDVPVREMLRLLDAGGYTGWISVEWEKRWHPEIEEPEIALPQHLAVLNQWATA
jgi:sugar phosphate isomerase/epimerase